MNDSILRTEENGVEFFTVVATGESAVSVRGLAKTSGIPLNTTSRWLIDLSQNKPPKGLESLIGKPLYLAHLSHLNVIKKRGKEIKPILADVAAEIIVYAALDLGKREAIVTLKAFSKIGLTSFIQSKTGWLPEQYKAASEAHKTVDRILDAPNPWERMYSKDFCDKAFSYFGAQFYWDYCYSFLTAEEQCKLNRLNPPINGTRQDRIHQYLDPATRDRLTPHVRDLVVLLDVCNSPEEFTTLYARRHGINQLSLF